MEEAAAWYHAKRMELDELLADRDFVSLHVSLTPETKHMINARTLAGCKPGAILVNTCRGGVVDTAALVDALRDGPLAAAGLDVYENEPAVPAELAKLPNTVLVPHIGSATRSTRDAMATLCADNVIAVLDGRGPADARRLIAKTRDAPSRNGARAADTWPGEPGHAHDHHHLRAARRALGSPRGRTPR